MTSDEIKTHVMKVMPVGDLAFWMREIAYQMAVRNERAAKMYVPAGTTMQFDISSTPDTLVTSEPGKRDAVSEGRTALDCRSNRVVIEGHFCCFGHPAEATPNGKVCCICSKPEPKPGPREQWNLTGELASLESSEPPEGVKG